MLLYSNFPVQDALAEEHHTGSGPVIKCAQHIPFVNKIAVGSTLSLRHCVGHFMAYFRVVTNLVM